MLVFNGALDHLAMAIRLHLNGYVLRREDDYVFKVYYSYWLKVKGR